MATLLEKMQQGSQPTSGGSLLERLQQAEQLGLVTKGTGSVTQPQQREAKPLFPGLAKTAATAGAAASGLVKTVGALPGGISKEEQAKIDEALTKERNVLGLGRSRPVGITEEGEQKGFGGQVKDILGAGLETGSFLAPGMIGTSALRKGATTGARIAGGAGAGALAGGTQALGEGLTTSQRAADIARDVFMGGALGAGVGAALPAAGALARKAPQAVRAVTTAAPKTAKTVVGATRRGVQQVPERIRGTFENIGDVATSAARVSAEPAPVRRAIASNIPERTVNIVKNINDDTRKVAKQMQTAAQAGETPKKVLAKPALDRVKFASQKAKEIGNKMDDAIDAMMLKQNNVVNPREEMLQELSNQGIVFNAKGQLESTGEFTTEQAKLLRRLVSELPSNEMLTPKQVVAAQRKLSRTIREAAKAKGINVDSLQTVAARLKAILTNNLSDEYRQLAREYAIVKQSIDEFLKLLNMTKKKGGYFTLEDIIEKADTRTGNRIMRLLNSDPTAAEEALGLLDDATRQLGYKGRENFVELAEIANTLEQIYDLVPSKSFKGGITAGVAEGIQTAGGIPGMIIGAAQKATGASRANQQKAFEALLGSLAK